MEILLSIMASIIIGYLTLYIFWLLPNQVFGNAENTPYHAKFFGILMATVAIMGILETYGGIKYGHPAYVIGGLAEITFGGTYLMAAFRRIPRKWLVPLRGLFALSAGYLIATLVIPVSTTLALIMGIATTILCMLPIPKSIERMLTPPKPEQTAWYHVIHKFPHLQNTTSTPTEESQSSSEQSKTESGTTNRTR